MGNLLYSDISWYVYRRVLSSDDWVQAPLQTWTGKTLEDALGFFKHEVYSFALSKHTEYEDTKAMYLYNGGQRVAKALLDPETRQVTVWSSSIREFIATSEKLAPQRYPEHEAAFFAKYEKKAAWVNPQTITFVHKD